MLGVLTSPASFSLGTVGYETWANPFHAYLEEEGHPAHPHGALQCCLHPTGPSSPGRFPLAIAHLPPLCTDFVFLSLSPTPSSSPCRLLQPTARGSQF